MSELPDDNPGEAHRWSRQAAEDLEAARRIAADGALPARIGCFLAHLSAEKALKALLIGSDVAFPRIHDLAELQALLPGALADSVDDNDIDLLNPWTIAGRYPEDIADAARREVDDCLTAAARIVELAMRELEGPPGSS